MQRYNPYTAAFSALTNADAREYYADRALEDIGTMIWCINHAANAAYQAGKAFRAFAERTEANAIECVAITVAPSSAIAPIENTDEVIDAEIIEESDIWLLPAQAEPATQTKADETEHWIINAIREDIAIAQAEATTQYLLAEAKKSIVKTQAKKRTPKANSKTATPAPRKSPTKARVGKYIASID